MPRVSQQVLTSDKDNISQVSLVKNECLPTNSATVPIQTSSVKGTVMLEQLDSLNPFLQIAESLVEVKEDGSTAVVITNTGKTSHHLKNGTNLG